MVRDHLMREEYSLIWSWEDGSHDLTKGEKRIKTKTCIHGEGEIDVIEGDEVVNVYG